MNWLDVVFIFVLVASIAASFSKGLAREVIGLIAAIAGLICGAWFYRMAGETVRPLVGSRQMANLCGFLMVFVGFLIAGWLVSLLVGWIVKAVGLSWLNKLAGAVFGAARGVVVCVAIITAIVAFAPGSDPNAPPQAVVHSRLAPYMMEVAHALTMAAPRELRDEFALRYRQIERLWEDALKRRLGRPKESEI